MKVKLKSIAGDSITGERFVTTKNKLGFIKPMNISDMFNNSTYLGIASDGKEYANPDDLYALTNNGWSKILVVMRHHTNKKIYRVVQKYGESIVTEDHSFMSIDLNETKPLDMVNTPMYRCNIPKVDHIIDCIDLYEYVKYFKLDVVHRGVVKTATFKSVDVLGQSYLTFGWENRKNPILLKRYISGNDLDHLCLLLSGYITEGSASFGARRGASICASNVAWLEKMQGAYNSLFSGARTCIIESCKKIRTIGNGHPYKDETRKFQMMNGISAALFSALCNHGARNKKLPDFVYNLETRFQKIILKILIEGDGYVNVSGGFEYSTISTELASDICTLLSILNIRYTVKFRENKHEYTIREVIGSQKNDVSTKILEEPSNCYVYDLTVENEHTFVDSIGQVLLHNTDSLYLSSNVKITPEQAEHIGEMITMEMSKHLPSPLTFAFEAFAERGLFLEKKRYAALLLDNNNKYKMKIKGLEIRRRDWCPIVGNTMQTVLDLVLKEGKVKEASDYVLQIFEKVKNIDINDSDILSQLELTRSYHKGPESYKVKPPHIKLVEKMMSRGDQLPGLGDRISYYIVDGSEDFNERAETIEYIRKSGRTIDNNYYLNKQLIPPLQRIFDALDIDMMTGKKIRRESDLMSFSKNDSVPVKSVAVKKVKKGLLAFI